MFLVGKVRYQKFMRTDHGSGRDLPKSEFIGVDGDDDNETVEEGG